MSCMYSCTSFLPRPHRPAVRSELRAHQPIGGKVGARYCKSIWVAREARSKKQASHVQACGGLIAGAQSNASTSFRVCSSLTAERPPGPHTCGGTPSATHTRELSTRRLRRAAAAAAAVVAPQQQLARIAPLLHGGHANLVPQG